MAAFTNFPYEIVETSGENALAMWEELKKAGRGAPIVLGNEEDLDNLLSFFEQPGLRRVEPVEEILAAAGKISFPDSLYQLREDERARTIAYLKQIGAAADFKDDERESLLDGWPDESHWPDEISGTPGLSVAYELISGEPKAKVHIALIPTDDPAAIPAYMHLGGWNECPSAAYHVAALRAWRDLYGAELIGMAFDTLNLRVSRSPATRKEALALARAQYFYCNDIVSQGVGSPSALAAYLMAHDWWYFWWD
jgi:hypothetical protein